MPQFLCRYQRIYTCINIYIYMIPVPGPVAPPPMVWSPTRCTPDLTFRRCLQTQPAIACYLLRLVDVKPCLWAIRKHLGSPIPYLQAFRSIYYPTSCYQYIIYLLPACRYIHGFLPISYLVYGANNTHIHRGRGANHTLRTGLTSTGGTHIHRGGGATIQYLQHPHPQGGRENHDHGGGEGGAPNLEHIYTHTHINQVPIIQFLSTCIY